MNRKLSPLFVSLLACLFLGGISHAQTAPRLALEQAAPEIQATTLDGKAVSLSSLRNDNKGKLLVIQFASITDPIYRSHAAAVEKLAIKESDKAVFVVLYQKESHAADGPSALELNAADGYNLAEPQSLDERTKLAKQTVERLKIKNQTVVVDAWSNASSTRYGGYPNMTFIVDAKGNLQAGYPFMDVTKVQASISLLAENQPLPPELKGPAQRSGPAPFDFTGAAMDMAGGRGPASIATVLERVNLTTEQRLKLMPAIADFLADVQTLRQVRQAVPNNAPARGAARGPNAPANAPANVRAGRGNGPAPSGSPQMADDPAMMQPNAPAPVRPNAAAAGAPPARPGAAAAEPMTVQDLQDAQAAIRASADRLKTMINQMLPKKDATALLEALDAMIPAQRLFQ